MHEVKFVLSFVALVAAILVCVGLALSGLWDGKGFSAQVCASLAGVLLASYLIRKVVKSEQGKGSYQGVTYR